MLKDHLSSGPKNAQYLAKEIHNELIYLCADDIVEQIIVKQKKVEFYSIVCDETKDISCIEQASVVLRYINKDLKEPEERFIGFRPLKGMDAAAIVDMLKEAITSCGLLLSSCRGQSYDGAAAISGHITGVQTRLRELEPKALFHICSAHALNLCVVRACTNAYIQNMFGTLQSLYTFFGGPKRHAVLQECKQEENSIRSRDKQRNLHSLSDTQWISRFSALQSFVLLYPAILNALEKLSTMNESDKTVSEASGLLGNIATFDFMISAEVARMVLNVTQPFSNYLQSPKLNLLQFKSTADITLESLKELRSADIFSDIFMRCCDKAKELEISISSTIRRRSRQDKVDIESYYRRELYFSVLDELIGQFQERLLSRGEIITAFGIFS